MPSPTPHPSDTFPSLGLGLAIRLCELLWHLALPLVFVYFWRRGKKEPSYRQAWHQRLGWIRCHLHRPIWIHAPSLGEVRGAVPWINKLVQQGQAVLLSVHTPAGHSSAHTLLREAIAARQVQVVWGPLELSWAVRLFLRRAQARCLVMTETDTWPVLFASVRRAGVPLALSNGQYPRASFERDQRRLWGFRARLFKAHGLVMCKSHLQAQRFATVGCRNIVVVGENRFDIPIAPAQLAQAQATRQAPLWQSRAVLCVASAIEGEDEIFLTALQALRHSFAQAGRPAPLCVYVPRSPQRFDGVHALFTQAGLRVLRRSQAQDAQLGWTQAPQWAQVDVYLGDSIGEMFYYLALSDAVVVGSSFGKRAVHNIIEPLALFKPVWTGPSVLGIEYPALEALQAGVLHHAVDGLDLAKQLATVLQNEAAYADLVERARHFNAAHAGAADKHLAAFLPWLASQSATR
jgi:3-deoxy-D-manno-octulosonic-acid transferase